MKRVLIILFSFVLAFSLAGTASAASAAGKSTVPAVAVKLTLNGKSTDLGSSGLYVSKGKAYAEYGALFKLLGYQTEFDKTMKAIHAVAEGVEIYASVEGDVAFMNDKTVPSKGEVVQSKGHTYIGIRFAGALTNHKVAWNGKTKTISLGYQGPTDEQKAAVYEVFNKMLLVEAAGDIEGLLGLFSDDTELDKDGIVENWKTTKTKTIVESKAIESYSDTEAVAIVVENTKKVSGAFFPDNKSQTRYTLHKAKDGSWKIFDIEVLGLQYTNIPGLFEQAATIPDAEKTAIGVVFADQLKAANAKDVEAYIATMTDIPDKDALKRHWRSFSKARR